MIKIAVLGYGTVGSGIVNVINTNKDVITSRIGKEIQISYVLDLRDFPNDPISEVLVHDYNIILEDESISIIAEAMGGIEPAFTFAKSAIKKGKHFCTSNKELVAKHGAYLIKLAKENNVSFLFEASVGGGIPIIRPLVSSLMPEQIEEITGILNGTTNYMLSKMESDGMDFNCVLEDAQERGYAERNPEADIEGYDACRKIAILSSLAYGNQVDFEDIYTEGITEITEEDIEYASYMRKRIKLLATARKGIDGVSVMVAPMLIDEISPLYSVMDVNNAILVKGNTLGEVMFFGAGAGMLPTASAVVSDIIELAKNLDNHICINWDESNISINKFGNIENKFFVRVDNSKKEDVKEVFGEVDDICIGDNGEYAFVTNIMKEAQFMECVEKIGNIISYIRVKD